MNYRDIETSGVRQARWLSAWFQADDVVQITHIQRIDDRDSKEEGMYLRPTSEPKGWASDGWFVPQVHLEGKNSQPPVIRAVTKQFIEDAEKYGFPFNEVILGSCMSYDSSEISKEEYVATEWCYYIPSSHSSLSEQLRTFSRRLVRQLKKEQHVLDDNVYYDFIDSVFYRSLILSGYRGTVNPYKSDPQKLYLNWMG